MSCGHCGVRIGKDDRFVLVGTYPGRWKRSGYSWFWNGPEYFGELYHEACYLELLGRNELKQKNRLEEPSDKLQQKKEEQPSTEMPRKRLVR